MTKEQAKSLLKDLDSLCRRLQDSYNGEEPFEQAEEDRTAVYHACEWLEDFIES